VADVDTGSGIMMSSNPRQTQVRHPLPYAVGRPVSS